MGGSEELQVEALWKLVGLSEALLNHLHARWQSGDIPDLIEFLADDWASALWHDRFLEFIHELKTDLSQKGDFMKHVEKVADGEGTRDGLMAKLTSENKQEMQDKVLRYLRNNTNHLHTYFLPEHWDAEVEGRSEPRCWNSAGRRARGRRAPCASLRWRFACACAAG